MTFIFPRTSLYFRLVPVQYRQYQYRLFCSFSLTRLIFYQEVGKHSASTIILSKSFVWDNIITGKQDWHSWSHLTVWPIFPRVTHISNCDPFCEVWTIIPISQAFFHVIHPHVALFPKLSHYFTCNRFSQVRNFFSSVIHFPKCDTYFKYDSFSQVWLIFLSVTLFFSFFLAWSIFSRDELFSKCDAFPSRFDLFFKSDSYFPSVTHIFKFDPF